MGFQISHRRMDWDEKNIKLLVGNVLMNTQDLDKTYNTMDLKSNGFRQPHYIVLTFASGGSVSKTKFPARFEVDYARLYQK